MKTIIKKISDAESAEYSEILNKASEIIKRGGLVAFPTETVYGLGADAFNPEAVNKIFKAKGRPQDNPLIVHIGSLDELPKLIGEKNKIADLLIENFWAGPLTLIFKKNNIIPSEVTGGLDTVAIRFPSLKITRDFINAAGAVVAPSANTSGKPSPTKASHVIYDLENKIDMIIDGGDSEFGLESTIVDVSGEKPYLLRPGLVTKEMIEKVIGQEIETNFFTGDSEKPKAPGMKYTHYSPSAKVVIVAGDLEKVVNEIQKTAILKLNESKKVGILATEQTKDLYDNDKFLVLSAGDRDNPETIGTNLYKLLRRFDFKEVDYILSENFAETQVGLAIMNRLKKAAGFNIVNV